MSRHQIQKVISILLVVLLTVLAGCGNKADGKPRTTEDGKTKVVFWHSMGGGAGEALQNLTDDFNSSQDKYFVEAVYQGSYEEGINKLKAIGGTADAPTVMQLYEIGTKFMSESGYIKPMQDFIDQDKFDVSQLQESILNYYTLDGKLYSMPFNTSNAVMFYNKDAFRAAGLDPENPPQTFEEMKEAARALTIKKGNSTEQYGFSILIYGWFFEQLMANQGALYLDQDNGRSGEPTKVLIAGEEGERIFTWLKEMHDEGTLGNFGRLWDDIRAAFKSGKVAMYLDSTAATAANVKDSSFEVGTAFIPVPGNVERNGVIVGGGSLWITNSVPAEEQQAAWEFIKYLTTPKVQAEWAAATGYFPINKAAYDEPSLKEVYEKYPQFLTSVEQLQSTKLNRATQGALMPVFPEARAQIEDAIEKMYQGESVQDVLSKAAQNIEKALEDYKRMSGK